MVIDKLKELKNTFRKEKKTDEVAFVSFVISEIEKIGKNSGNRETTNDEAIVSIKKILSNIDEYITLSPTNKELIFQKETLQSLLPKEASDDDVRKFLIDNSIKTQKDAATALKKEFGVNVNMKTAMIIFKEIIEG